MRSAALRVAASVAENTPALLGFLPVLLAIGGCANVRTRLEVQDIPETIERQESVVPDSPHISARVTPIGEELVVNISSGDRCAVTETPIVHRIAHERKILSPSLAVYEYGGAVLLGALGAVAIADASGLASSIDNTSGASPTTYQITGGALIGVGIAFLIAGIVDSARATDRDRDEGQISLPGRTTEGDCHLENVQNAQAKVVLRSGKAFYRTTDAAGVIRLGMHDVAAEDIPDREGGAEVAIGNRVAGVLLDDPDRRSLLARLLADPSSRAAVDAAAALKSSCDAVLSAARRVRLTDDLGAPAETAAREAWAKAPGTCEYLWTPEAQTESSKALASMDAIDSARAQREAAEAQAHLRRAWELLNRKASLASIKAERAKAFSQGGDVGRLDAAIQVKENQELVQRWTVFAKHCASLQSDKEAVERVRSCDANCRKVLAKVEGAWEKLQSEQPPAVPASVADAERVKELCEKAGCPSCPQ